MPATRTVVMAMLVQPSTPRPRLAPPESRRREPGPPGPPPGDRRDGRRRPVPGVIPAGGVVVRVVRAHLVVLVAPAAALGATPAAVRLAVGALVGGVVLVAGLAAPPELAARLVVGLVPGVDVGTPSPAPLRRVVEVVVVGFALTPWAALGLVVFVLPEPLVLVSPVLAGLALGALALVTGFLVPLVAISGVAVSLVLVLIGPAATPATAARRVVGVLGGVLVPLLPGGAAVAPARAAGLVPPVGAALPIPLAVVRSRVLACPDPLVVPRHTRRLAAVAHALLLDARRAGCVGEQLVRLLPRTHTCSSSLYGHLTESMTALCRRLGHAHVNERGDR
ncbi:hypothetical protein [Microtetraspora malaysiensis]|uniref:hypothetical protein n=1 Tax=Microtetraspora malaysiensis TaxID=161358 RepID=UPI003D92909B